jgi:nucleoside-diphosphate-sugar epimerase
MDGDDGSIDVRHDAGAGLRGDAGDVVTVVAVTGAGGFIGAALTQALRRRGDHVIALARRPGSDALRWQLGEDLPAACAAADAVIHLASAALAPDEPMADAVARDLAGTRRLLAQIRDWRRQRPCRFIFLSSQSARADARNAYGRSKWVLEGELAGPDEIAVRPGLVYSDPPASVFASFAALARLPLLPRLGGAPCIQPIAVDDLAEALVRLAHLEAVPPRIMLGAVTPLTFEQALRDVAHRAGRRPPVFVPVPQPALRTAAWLVDRVTAGSLTERLDGLTALRPMDTAPSLALLGLTLAPFDGTGRP